MVINDKNIYFEVLMISMKKRFLKSIMKVNENEVHKEYNIIAYDLV